MALNNATKTLFLQGMVPAYIPVESEQKSFRLELGSESYLSTAADATQARIVAAGEALLKTSYDFTHLPPDLKR